MLFHPMLVMIIATGSLSMEREDFFAKTGVIVFSDVVAYVRTCVILVRAAIFFDSMGG